MRKCEWDNAVVIGLKLSNENNRTTRSFANLFSQQNQHWYVVLREFKDISLRSLTSMTRQVMSKFLLSFKDLVRLIFVSNFTIVVFFCFFFWFHHTQSPSEWGFGENFRQKWLRGRWGWRWLHKTALLEIDENKFASQKIPKKKRSMRGMPENCVNTGRRSVAYQRSIRPSEAFYPNYSDNDSMKTYSSLIDKVRFIGKWISSNKLFSHKIGRALVKMSWWTTNNCPS